MDEKEFEGKNILVTGATGLVGSRLVPFLLRHGANVIAVSRHQNKLEHTFKRYAMEKLELFAKDVIEPLDFIEVPLDYIFHAAGIISGKTIKEHPISVIKTNLEGLKNCYELLRKQYGHGKSFGRVIVFSSATVYGNVSDKDICVAEQDAGASMPLDAANASYSESKRMSEIMALSYWREFGISTVIARPSYVYGPVMNVPQTAFYNFVGRVLSGQDIVMNNSSLPRRDNIYVDDVVSGLARIAQKGLDGEAYNISSNGESGNFASIDEMANQLVKLANAEYAQDVSLAYKDGLSKQTLPGICIDNQKLKKLGWTPKTSLLDGCRNTLSFYRNEVHV